MSAVDIAPTFLNIAGVEPDENFEGEDFTSVFSDPEKEIRQYVFAQAHWHDVERMYRAVRDTRFKYIRNFYPDLPNSPPADALNSMTYRKMLELKESNMLNSDQLNIFVSPTSKEELYDTKSDPFELNNLASDPEYAEKLDEMQTVLQRFMDDTGDVIPQTRTPDEYDRLSGAPLPAMKMPRENKKVIDSIGR